MDKVQQDALDKMGRRNDLGGNLEWRIYAYNQIEYAIAELNGAKLLLRIKEESIGGGFYQQAIDQIRRGQNIINALDKKVFEAEV